jgi:F0F1-type ATP synthase membrane subunit b/b'
MAKEITHDVEALEVEAEKILEEARTRANQMLLEAREEAKKIVS